MSGAIGGKQGRNEPCACGSGKKFKHCCALAPRPAPAAAGRAANPFQIGEALLKAGRFADAIAPLQQATRLAPSNAALLNDLGMACLLAGRPREAIAWLQRALALRPDVAGTHYGLGMALEQSGDGAGAIDAYRGAVARAPGLADAHARLAELLLPRAQVDEAIAAYERAASSAPAATLGRLCEAKALVLRERAADAEARLRDLVTRDPACAEAHVVLGRVLGDAGRFADAAASFERAIALAPGAAPAHFGLVSSRRMTEADRPALARILARIDAGAEAPPQRMTLHFAAGKALDDLGDRAEAMAQFDAANRIRRVLAPFDRDEFARLIDRTIARHDAAFFADVASRAGALDPEEAPLLVVGMPRSGTTLVERILSAHPRVAGGGELTFWNEHARPRIDAGTGAAGLASEARELRAGYLRVLRAIGPDAARVTDKMPFNFLWAGLVHALFPGARFVHCRRNPVDTCLSIYTTHFASNWGFASDRADLAYYYRQYLRLMDHWRAVLPADRLLDIDYERVTREPAATAHALVAFAGLPWDEACARPESNPGAVRTASRWQARQPVYRTSVERWRLYEPWLGELRALMPDGDGDRDDGASPGAGLGASQAAQNA